MKNAQLQAAYNRLTAVVATIAGGQSGMGMVWFEQMSFVRLFADSVTAKPRTLGVEEAAALWLMSDLLGRANPRNWARKALVACGETVWANRYYPHKDILVGVPNNGGKLQAERGRRVSRLNTMSLAGLASGAGKTNNNRRYLLTKAEQI